jgi:Carboxypeptidase regulatory-like domain
VRNLKRRFGCALLLCAAQCPLAAQSTFGSFVGTVIDPGGAVIPDAMVNAVSRDTKARRSTLSDATGNYSIVNLEPGVYEVTVEAKGFARAVFANLTLESRQTLRINATLSVASQTETVSVEAAADVVLATDTSSIANAKQGRELNDLPVAIASRGSGSTSPISTLTTQPGVQTDSGGSLSIAGAKPSMLSVSLDGISTVSPRSSAPIAELFPTFGAIAEIRVSEINNTAEFGGVSDITTTSRGGSNQFHGGLFNNFQNTALNARNTFSATVPKLDMNDFGAYGGGYLRIPHLYSGRNKTFFFASYEGLRLAKESVLLESVPSAALRTGDLSAYKSFKDPDSGNPFPDNRIPVSRISPISAKALDLYFPLPNTGAPGAIANNFALNFPTPITSDQGDIRIDQNIDSRQTAFARFSYKKRNVSNAPTGSVNAGATLAPEIDTGFTLAHNFVVSSRVVNEFRGGFNGTLSSSSNKTSAVQTLAQLGFTGIPDPPPGSGGPGFTITGFQSATFGSSSISKGNTLQFIDNLTWIRGRHTLKFGGDYRYMTAYFSNVFASSRAGSYSFNNSVTSSIIGNPYAAFLLGVPDSSSLATVKNPDTFSYGSSYAFYGQDDWKPTSRLTVNFGLRWEYHPVFNDHFNNLADFLTDYRSVVNGVSVNGAVVVPDAGMKWVNPDFAASIAPTPILSASQAGIPQSLHYSQKTSFAPRLGFAWRPFGDDKTVIRGGVGRYVETLLSALITAGWAVEASEVGSFSNSVVNGKPALTFPYPFPANLSQPGVATFEYASALHYKDPYVTQWNLTVERSLGWSTALRVTYDGSHGSDLGYSINANQVAANTVGFNAAKASAPFPIWAHITDYVNGALSNYDALTVAASKRFTHGLQFQSSYAFAKNLSNGAGYAPSGFTGEAGGRVTDPQNIALDYGNVAFTRRHRFLSTFLYDVPFGKGKPLFTSANGFVDRVVGGWQVAGVLLFQTGPFLTVTASSADPMGTNFPNLEGAGRADIVPGVDWMPQNRSVANWVNPAAFAIPANNIGRGGNSSIGSVIGPGTQAVSLSLFKTVRIRESAAIQLGAAASNLFNHPNYGTPSLNLASASTFGKITSLQSQENGGPRSLQLTGRITF